MLIKSSWQASLLLNTNNNYNKTFHFIVVFMRLNVNTKATHYKNI